MRYFIATLVMVLVSLIVALYGFLWRHAQEEPVPPPTDWRPDLTICHQETAGEEFVRCVMDAKFRKILTEKSEKKLDP